MKKIIIGLAGCLVGLLAACGSSDEERAARFLQSAEQAWKSGAYSRAKTTVDSIRLLYPKAFEARRRGMELMREVEEEEQRKGLVYLDSLLKEKQTELEAIRSHFVLEKDTAYQEEGNYFIPSQTVERSLNRTFLRAQVSERGAMTLTSIYCGASFIHHTSVKVMSGDTYAETPVSDDMYETTNSAWKIEKADYPLGKDGGVIGYIAENRERPIRVEFRGDRSYTVMMLPADRQAVAELYELARLLSSMEQIREAQAEAQRKIAFIIRKKNELQDKEK